MYIYIYHVSKNIYTYIYIQLTTYLWNFMLSPLNILNTQVSRLAHLTYQVPQELWHVSQDLLAKGMTFHQTREENSKPRILPDGKTIPDSMVLMMEEILH